MVLMRVKLDNFLVFDDFELNLSYPKKIVGSTIPNEYLKGRPNFRYKKVVVLMGANATGKTALGKVLMGIFNFITRKESYVITQLIEDKKKDAMFEADIAFDNFMLVRIAAIFKARDYGIDEYDSESIRVSVYSEKILSSDNYETCAGRFVKSGNYPSENYITELEKVPDLTWKFEYPLVGEGKQRSAKGIDTDAYCDILGRVLTALDPRIIKVEKVNDVKNTYVIRYPHNIVLLNENDSIGLDKLSSGTAESIGVAELITVMKLDLCQFFYCDEKFSHIHADAERAFLSVLIELLGPNYQLFFTSHDPALLDMDLPKHSYAFLRRDVSDQKISCVFASEYLKKNTDSLRNAVENDIFSSSPDIGRIYELAEPEGLE